MVRRLILTRTAHNTTPAPQTMASAQLARPYLGLSYDDINRLPGRMTRNQAMALWQWAAPRFSSLGTAQERYFNRYGAAATFARINRVRSWLGLDPV